MIGKRIILLTAGATVLLSLSAYGVFRVYEAATMLESDRVVMEQVNSIQSDSISDIATSTDKSEVVQIDVQTTGLENTITPKMVFEIYHAKDAVDVFGINQLMFVGRDSRSDAYTASTSVMQYEEVEEGNFVHKYVTLEGYSGTVQVVVVGLDRTNTYELTGEWVSALGERKEVSFLRRIDPYELDRFTIKLNDGSFDEKRENYAGVFESSHTLEASVPGCEFEPLYEQLMQKLKEGGWAAPDSAKETIRYGSSESAAGILNLPFENSSVCAVEVTWLSVFEDSMMYEQTGKSIFSAFPYSDEKVEVGGIGFGQLAADGPFSSLLRVPFTETGEAIQFYEIQTTTKRIPVNFPSLTVCPCSFENRILLTAPMYPKEDAELEGG